MPYDFFVFDPILTKLCEIVVPMNLTSDPFRTSGGHFEICPKM